MIDGKRQILYVVLVFFLVTYFFFLVKKYCINRKLHKKCTTVLMCLMCHLMGSYKIIDNI